MKLKKTLALLSEHQKLLKWKGTQLIFKHRQNPSLKKVYPSQNPTLLDASLGAVYRLRKTLVCNLLARSESILINIQNSRIFS